MGLLDALIQSSSRFHGDLLPTGYAERGISWVINISSQDEQQPIIDKKGTGEMALKAPATPADRTSGKVSPSLLVDKVSYVSGFPNSGKKGDSAKISSTEHKSYLELLRQCAEETNDSQVKRILDFLQHCSPFIPGAKANDLCAFQVEQQPWPTDSSKVQLFWSKYVAERLAKDKQQCALCRQIKPITRILPFKTSLLKGTDPVQLSSFNKDAFCSGGSTTSSALNAPLCYECTSTAGQVLQFLLRLYEEKRSGRHAVVLARDDSKGKGKQPLCNQIAVFWTKEQMELQVKDGDKRDFEELAKAPIEEFDEIPEDATPVKIGQCRTLLEAPFAGGRDTATLPANRFYLAVLSPNKSRLVMRQWLETDIEPARKNISRYLEALQVVHPDGRGIWWPTLPAMMEALQSYTSRRQKGKEGSQIAAMGPDVMHKLVRCIYAGTPPPEALLTRAVRCFRVPDPSTDDRQQKERQMLRRMAMAAAMKLVLTYDNDRKEQQAMEQLKTEHDAVSDYKQQAPYNCGALLAIMEAIQQRASSSGRGVNTTLVDRFYGAASTAPATVLANIINMATKAHLPKLRREGKELFKVRSQEDTVNINDLMTEACKAIDDAGGFPPLLTPEKQAQFALGFYHQRAELNSPKKQPKNNIPNNKSTTGGRP